MVQQKREVRRKKRTRTRRVVVANMNMKKSWMAALVAATRTVSPKLHYILCYY
jgi:hypothetical protein